MSRSLYAAIDFLREVTLGGQLWVLRGLPDAPEGITGERALPIWSSAERARKALARGRLSGVGELVEVTWPEFRNTWVQTLNEAALRIGLNWSGPDVTGVAWTAEDLVSAIESGHFRGADPRQRRA
jgi:hypothetical protein